MNHSSSTEQCRFKDRTVLVVEDQYSNYYLLEILLNRWGIKTIRAATGYEAIEECQNNSSINLVLMDIRLPDLNGFEATKEIRKTNPNLPIIAQTAHVGYNDCENATEAGCNDYIPKPIRKDLLYELLLKYLE